METLDNYGWLITFALIALVLFIIIFGAYKIAKYGKKLADQENEYKKKYDKISNVIDNYQVCEPNFDWINCLFDHLRDLPYKNPEMTKVLYDRFTFKYQEIIEKRKEII